MSLPMAPNGDELGLLPPLVVAVQLDVRGRVEGETGWARECGKGGRGGGRGATKTRKATQRHGTEELRVVVFIFVLFSSCLVIWSMKASKIIIYIYGRFVSYKFKPFLILDLDIWRMENNIQREICF